MIESLDSFSFGKFIVFTFVEHSQVMREVVYGILQDSFRLIEAIHVNEILIVQIYLIHVSHNTIHLLFFGGFFFFGTGGFIDGFFVSIIGGFLFSWHYFNLIYIQKYLILLLLI
jgi:hypothetical protein